VAGVPSSFENQFPACRGSGSKKVKVAGKKKIQKNRKTQKDNPPGVT